MSAGDPGFAVLPGIFTDGEIDSVCRAVEDTRVPRSRAGVRNMLAHAAVSSLAGDARLVGIASDALGAPAFPYKATLFDKSGRANWLVTWHQDTVLPVARQRDVPGWGPWSLKAGVLHAHAPAAALERVVALRVHLDEATAANGPLRVLPRTHRMGVLSHARIQQLVATSTAVECHVGRGGVVLMRPLVVHASSKATDATPRRVLHIEYAVSCALGAGLELAVVR